MYTLIIGDDSMVLTSSEAMSEGKNNNDSNRSTEMRLSRRSRSGHCGYEISTKTGLLQYTYRRMLHDIRVLLVQAEDVMGYIDPWTESRLATAGSAQIE